MIYALHSASVSLGAYIILVIVLRPRACDVWYIRWGFTADSPGAEIGSQVICAGDEAAGHEKKAEHDNEEAETEDGLEYSVSLVHGGCWGHTDREHRIQSLLCRADYSLKRKLSESSRKFHNDGKGPTRTFFCLDSTNYDFHI